MGSGGRGMRGGTEEEPAQIETRQCLCFGAESPSGLAPFPASASPATSSTSVLKAKLGGPCGYSSGAFRQPERPTQGLDPEQTIKEEWFLQEVWAWWLSGTDGFSPSSWLAWAAMFYLLWAGRVLRQNLTPAYLMPAQVLSLPTGCGKWQIFSK